MIRTFDWKGKDPHGGSSIYGCKFIKPDKSAILAVGANKNGAKVFSADTGNLLLDVTEMDPIINASPVVSCDVSPQGRTVVIGSATGVIHCKNIAVFMGELTPSY